MTDNEASKVVYFTSAVGSAPHKAEELKSIVLREDSTAHFKGVVDAIQKLVEESSPFDAGFLTRLETRLRRLRSETARSSDGCDPRSYAVSALLGAISHRAT
ncbi:hypothetical protein EDM68_03695 [Candidatus Uhrbacteria bacterium]|nr:MAG: hypothetical protein EDM68_03695 [Candidatus Uhrbacteria bacterium]